MKSLNELRAIKNKMMCQVNLRLGGEAAIHAEAEGAQVHKNYILVCGGTGCTSNHSLDVVKAFETHLKEHGLQDDVKIIQTGCLGLCAKGPVVVVHPGSVYYEEVDPEKVEAIVNEHIVGGVPTDKYMLKEETTDGSPAKTMTESDFYTKQERIALRNCGVIDPENIDEYIATGGYEALGRCLTEMTPDEVIQTVLDSGIRGRGGAGFPTGKKWKFASGNRGEVQKYVCCNADEGDPGAFMDRSILEGDPHSVFEAMAIAGYAIGADQGYIYVRAEYPIAVNRLEIALKQGAVVCGEETALLTSIEGNRGEPHPRPPFPAVKGLFGCPTILNNVETYANIPVIFNKGPEWFSSLGTELSPGTKVFALGGKINNTGLVEVPMGTTLRDVVENIGGGVPNGKKFKAAQTGGPSGGCIPSTYYDIPIDFENLKSIGCMMGSGGLIVMDEDSCMVDIAKFFLEFTVSESCGKCTPCRVGTKRMLEILTRISEGKGEMEDLEKLEELANFIQTNSLCGLGQTAPNPVLSTMRFFRDEYVAHIKDKTCPAGVCKKLLKYSIIEEKCKGCTLCARNCPVDAISGAVKTPHVIDTAKCIKCGACMDNCRFGAIIRK